MHSIEWLRPRFRTALLVLCGTAACGTEARPTGSLLPGGAAASRPASGGGTSGQAAGGAGAWDLTLTGPTFLIGPGGELGQGGAIEPAAAVEILDLRIEPTDATVRVGAGQQVVQPFEVFGHLSTDPQTEVNLTDTSVFYVPEGFLVGGFPSDGRAEFTSRLPSANSPSAQRGGRATVRAQAASSDGSIETVTTSLTVVLEATVTPEANSAWATPALPVDPALHFEGAPEPTAAPELFYPNDGVLLPPNLGRLEIHFLRGNPNNELFRVHLQSGNADLNYYTRCYSDPAQFVDDACVLFIEGDEYEWLAASNQGQGPVSLTLSGSTESGQFGQADSIDIEFAEERIDGAVYYWNAQSPESIVRFDFGNGTSEPETFVAPSDVPGNNGSCVGCHALSRQGDKMFFALGNSADGQIMFVDDMTVSQADAEFYTYNGAQTDLPRARADQENRILTGSFSPSGDQFVATAPTNDAAADTTLFFHSGTTGVRETSVSLPFIPSHPDWSPLGDAIAMSAIEGDNRATISFLGSGIAVLPRVAGVWDVDNAMQVVSPVAGKNRFNPTFFPDGSILLYSEVDQASYSGSRADSCDAASASSEQSRFCDGYSDPGTKTWAVAPSVGATAVLLAQAAAPGPADALFPPPQANVAADSLMDTFPKPTPFQITHRGQSIGWFTVSSQRRAGLRRFFLNNSVVGDPATQALLWMFALDASEVVAGRDGSRPGFFLPFQDLSTSNHMAQWTERIVSDAPAPEPPTPAVPPAPPPAPPPQPVIY